MGWVAPEGGGWTTMHCARCVRSNFSSSLTPSLARARARARPSLRCSQPSSLSLRPVLSSSACPLTPLPPSTSDNYCSQPLSLPSIPRFFPMATSSLKAASSTSRSAGIQPSMRGRVVPSCREHAVLSSLCKMCACAAFIPLSLIRPSLSFADSC